MKDKCNKSYNLSTQERVSFLFKIFYRVYFLFPCSFSIDRILLNILKSSTPFSINLHLTYSLEMIFNKEAPLLILKLDIKKEESIN